MSTSSSDYDHRRDQPIIPGPHRYSVKHGDSPPQPQEQVDLPGDLHADSLFGKAAKAPVNAVVMDRKRIIKALTALDVALINHPFLQAHPEIKATLRIVGGAAIILRHSSRLATSDIDAKVWPEQGVLSISDSIAAQEGLGMGWHNDASNRYLPENGNFLEFKELGQLKRMAILLADDETLLAMKCHALRGDKDSDDIRQLAKVLRMTTAAELRILTNSMYGRPIFDDGKFGLLEAILNEHL